MLVAATRSKRAQDVETSCVCSNVESEASRIEVNRRRREADLHISVEDSGIHIGDIEAAAFISEVLAKTGAEIFEHLQEASLGEGADVDALRAIGIDRAVTFEFIANLLEESAFAGLGVGVGLRKWQTCTPLAKVFDVSVA